LPPDESDKISVPPTLTTPSPGAHRGFFLVA
jgi:uncharacterized protein DUF3606